MPSGGYRNNAGRKSTFSDKQKVILAREYYKKADNEITQQRYEWAYSLCDDDKISELSEQLIKQYKDLMKEQYFFYDLLREFVEPYGNYNLIQNNSALNLNRFEDWREPAERLVEMMIEHALGLENPPRFVRFRNKIVRAVSEHFTERWDSNVSTSQVNKAIRQFPRKVFDFGH